MWYHNVFIIMSKHILMRCYISAVSLEDIYRRYLQTHRRLSTYRITARKLTKLNTGLSAKLDFEGRLRLGRASNSTRRNCHTPGVVREETRPRKRRRVRSAGLIPNFHINLTVARLLFALHFFSRPVHPNCQVEPCTPPSLKLFPLYWKLSE